MDLLFPINEIFLDETPSTNTFLLNKNKVFDDWTIVSTTHQTSGRGYAGNQWESNIGQNLTFSIYIRPTFTINPIFNLSKIVANAFHKALSNFVSCQIKWPNDLIINHKKVGGILIENTFRYQINSSVIGIGLNGNQTDFLNLPKATSLKNETGIHCNIDELRYLILTYFQKEYQLLMDKEFQQIDSYFHNNLYKKDQISVFRFQNRLENGIIKGTTFDGSLIIELENTGLKHFKFKEIELLF